MACKEQVASTFDDLDFLDSKAWDTLYKRNKSSPPVEWYVSWDDLRPLITPVLEGLQDVQGQPKILVPACGNSKLSENLYLRGFKDITNVDYSSELIKLMKEKHKDKVGMQWLTKDIMAPLQDPPNLIPSSYDVLIDRGCFDSIGVLADEKCDEICGQYILKVKELLGNRGKYICLTRLFLEDSIAFFCRRFWLGWKVIVHKVFPQKDDDKAVMLVIERCSTGLLHDITEVDKRLSRDVAKENRLRDTYRNRAKSMDVFESNLREHGTKSYYEVDYILPQSDGIYRVIVLTDDKWHEVNTVDILWVPEDRLVLNLNALTSSKHWQLEHFFSTLTRASHMLLVVLSPKLHLVCDRMQPNEILVDLKPLLYIIDPNIQVGWLQMWDAQHDEMLKNIEFLPAPISSKSSHNKKVVAGKRGTSKHKGKRRLEKGDECGGEDNNDKSAVGSDVQQGLDQLDEVVGDEPEEKVNMGASVNKELRETTLDVIEEAVSFVKEGEEEDKVHTDFPRFYDGDEIPHYLQPFTLVSWLSTHQRKEDRYLCEYLKWKDILPSECPNLLKRETLKIMQSIIIAVLDHHERWGPHGHLDNLSNFLITQVVFNHVGSKVVRFDTKLEDAITINGSLVKSKMQEDMHNVMKILEKLLEGVKEKNSEMQILADLLFGYPYEVIDKWKILFLKHFPVRILDIRYSTGYYL